MPIVSGEHFDQRKVRSKPHEHHHIGLGYTKKLLGSSGTMHFINM